MSKYIKAKDIDENITWKEITPAGNVYESGTSTLVNTGEWRSMKPVFIADKCKQCMLCVPVCPDMAIPVNSEGKREDFDFFFCKGCGICYEVCPFDAIEFVKNVR